MNNYSFAFLLTILAGLSTMIGTVVIFIKRYNHNKIVLSSLAFAAGVMICVSITDLVPEALTLLRGSVSDSSSIILCILGIILGVVISMLIDYYLPDKPISNTQDKSLFKVGIISMIAIILHNIPEGISISVPLYYSTGSKKRAIMYTLISALSEPFGALLAYLFLKDIMNDIILGILFSIIAGIMLQISFCELIPTTKKYNNKKTAIIFFILGVIFMLLKFII